MTGSLDRGRMEGCYQLLKEQQEAGEEEDTSLLIDIQQTVAICPHYQQGRCHWVMHRR